jgi:hypothetical protein
MDSSKILIGLLGVGVGYFLVKSMGKKSPVTNTTTTTTKEVFPMYPYSYYPPVYQPVIIQQPAPPPPPPPPPPDAKKPFEGMMKNYTGGSDFFTIKNMFH